MINSFNMYILCKKLLYMRNELVCIVSFVIKKYTYVNVSGLYPALLSKCLSTI
jgi:hypothetical protein